MRRIVTGVDDGGASRVIEETTFPHSDSASLMDVIHQTPTSPPPDRPLGRGAFVDLDVAPGIARWMLVQFPPRAEAPMHHTDTIDFDTIIAGSVELLLHDGSHRLGPGDCVVVTGVDHGWRAGPEGCTSSVVVIGTRPPAQAHTPIAPASWSQQPQAP